MAINVIINLKIILLVSLALCALLITNTEATSSLSELYNKCENKFWFKDQKDFKKHLKSKCLKEDNHYHEKRHRQYHACNNKSHDKKLLASKWEKFSDCRCEAALVELSDFKKSKVFACYQIASFNKATGEFLGELSVYKKKSKEDLAVAIKFSHEVKLLDNGWHKYKKDYYSPKDHPQYSSDIGKFEVDKYHVIGRIPKSDSMNKISVNKLSPTEFLLIIDKERLASLKKDRDFTIVPFSKFVPSGNFLEYKEYKEHKEHKEHEYKDKDKNKDKPSTDPSDGNPGKDKPDEPNKPQDDKPQDDTPQDDTGDGYGDGYGDAGGDGNGGDGNGGAGGDGNDGNGGDGNGGAGGDGYGDAGGGGAGGDGYGGDVPQSGAGPNNAQDDTATDPVSSTDPTNISTGPTAASAGQESSGNVKSKGISSAAIGSIVFGVIIAIGGAFVGYNTYERLRWRRQYRRRQAAAQQNTSLANVPDYNGYGKAY